MASVASPVDAPVQPTPAPSAAAGLDSSPWPRGLLICGLAAAAYGPLMVWHFAGLLQRPHYQFIVFLPVALVLLWRRDEFVDGGRPPRWAAPLVAMLAVGAVGSLLLAARVFSPWLAMASVLLAALPLAWCAGGWGAVRRTLPAWVFCFVALPPPSGMDEDVIIKLREVTRRMTSSVLDDLGVRHLSYGHVIELPGKSLFIADACSGIHSLFVLFAAALFISLWRRARWPHTAALLLATVGVVLVENVLRLAVVAKARDWQVDLSMGLPHEVLGFGLFCLSVLFLISADQLLQFLIPLPAPAPPDVRRSGSSRRLPALAIGLLLGGALAAAGAPQWPRMPSQPPDLSSLTGRDLELPTFGEEALPAELAGFRREAFTTIARVKGDPLGQASQQWTFTRDDVTALVSIDYPYAGLHDLCVCYGQTGWTIDDKQLLAPEALGARGLPAEGPVAVGRMQRRLYGRGLLLFSLCDDAGNTGAVIKELARGDAGQRAANRWESFAVDLEPERPVAAPQGRGAASAIRPHIQFQLLARTHAPLTPEREQELLALYVEARRLLKEQCLTSLKSPEGPP